MAGTKAGGLKAAATNRAKYGKEFYARIGQKGGRISRRGPATTSTSTPISMIDESEESKIEVRVA